MRKTATPIVLSEAEQETLRSWLRAGTSEQRMVERTQIVPAAAEGVGTNEIARQLGTRAARVAKWRTRFGRDRLMGLADAPRPGARARYDATFEVGRGSPEHRWRRHSSAVEDHVLHRLAQPKVCAEGQSRDELRKAERRPIRRCSHGCTLVAERAGQVAAPNESRLAPHSDDSTAENGGK